MKCEHPDRPHYARGLCATCYVRHLRSGSLGAFPTQPMRTPSRNPAPRILRVIEEVEAGVIQRLDEAPRLGLSPRTVTDYLYAAGRRDLVRRLKGEDS